MKALVSVEAIKTSGGTRTKHFGASTPQSSHFPPGHSLTVPLLSLVYSRLDISNFSAPLRFTSLPQFLLPSPPSHYFPGKGRTSVCPRETKHPSVPMTCLHRCQWAMIANSNKWLPKHRHSLVPTPGSAKAGQSMRPWPNDENTRR